ncbi:hypothetical protein GOB86_06565 [Acetobacter lambici]|uniref:Uncharacterized protein n=1 Tax=Acetobacter lambici TaxID=1332824 RepID=A0ABT1EZ68_9PROT|nr:hypothetical protein [Acetobacter lambici]MCP1242233.1 hypothetical protein [Acetobacter lambici]MCP1258250.1 hypothetical protein [Acetobacter lambici]NHO56730.1 hypothetical protein [Acetobacter lambici]
MNTTPGTPDALLWKLAHLAAGVENKACEDIAISLDLQEIAQLLQDIKNALPADNEWSLYLTPAIIWSTVWSLYQNSLELGGYQNRDAMVQLVRDAVESLKNAFQANSKAAGVRSIGMTAALERGALSAD